MRVYLYTFLSQEQKRRRNEMKNAQFMSIYDKTRKPITLGILVFFSYLLCIGLLYFWAIYLIFFNFVRFWSQEQKLRINEMKNEQVMSIYDKTRKLITLEILVRLSATIQNFFGFGLHVWESIRVLERRN